MLTLTSYGAPQSNLHFLFLFIRTNPPPPQTTCYRIGHAFLKGLYPASKRSRKPWLEGSDWTRRSRVIPDNLQSPSCRLWPLKQVVCTPPIQHKTWWLWPPVKPKRQAPKMFHEYCRNKANVYCFTKESSWSSYTHAGLCTEDPNPSAYKHLKCFHTTGKHVSTEAFPKPITN